ncbi:MAG: hypothetical protein UT55_C0019G0001 [Candidatus Peregrinibacteria bacterium GW2011_GWE2_39_6]|nr:MAG: hypothetical protein UT36_C0009G0014 [Candidatus Peregrinibacteria bacterium GW2011_GWF2_39_17]KKR26051.1 MAG: hypothetical protein UT55_C0019G0001 [Candidatus Peregrinibacteria bacterium GW2011_GWE2_39_6]
MKIFMKSYLCFFFLIILSLSGLGCSFNIPSTDSPSDWPTVTQNETILVDIPKINEEIQSPLVIQGKAPGAWYFEGVFPIKLLNEAGEEIALTQAQAEGDWMTDQMVPFRATLIFPTPLVNQGILRFAKDNPSGLPENDQIFDLPVKFASVDSLDYSLFWGSTVKDPGGFLCDQVYPVTRKATRELTMEEILSQLLIGPLENEKNEGYFSSLNAGIQVNSISIKGDTAFVDFNEALDQAVGGSCRVVGIRAQITQTIKAISFVKDVVISINGETETILQP